MCGRPMDVCAAGELQIYTHLHTHTVTVVVLGLNQDLCQAQSGVNGTYLCTPAWLMCAHQVQCAWVSGGEDALQPVPLAPPPLLSCTRPRACGRPGV